LNREKNGDLMKLRGINRIIVAVKDLDKSKKFYSDVLGATFHEANWTGEPVGIS
jgi:catechol 2,3-dioxygenase-like lactoylglutathione lyase family enzyme